MAEITSDTELNLKVRLEINDVKDYQYWIERNTFFKRPISLMVLVVVGIEIIHGMIEIVMNIIRGGINEAYVGNGFIVLVGIIFILARGIWGFIYINKITKRAFDSNKLIQKEQQIKITDTTITINSGESITKINWEEIYCIRESKKQFLIYTAINKSIIIPKRFFEKNEDLFLLRDIIKDVISKEKVKKSKSYFT